jgi:hypothetical protein
MKIVWNYSKKLTILRNKSAVKVCVIFLFDIFDFSPYITYLIFCIEMSFVVLKIKGSSNDFIPKI